MATLLDLGLLNYFLPFFIFLFVFVILYALLEKTKILGPEQRPLNLIAAICVAAVSVFAGKFTSLLSFVIPWIVFIVIILVMIFFLFGSFGIEGRKVWDLFGETVVFVLILLILVLGISVVFESSVSPYQTSDLNGANVSQVATTVSVEGTTNPRSEALKTITHPRILGAMFILVMSAATVHWLTKQVEAPGK